MRRLIKITVILAVIGGIGYGISVPVRSFLKARGMVAHREDEVVRGDITAVVNSTGTLQAVRTYLVGSFVSGPIIDVYVDFNTEVEGYVEPVEMDSAATAAEAAKFVEPEQDEEGPGAVVGALFHAARWDRSLLAKVDPRLFTANVARDLASLKTRQAEVARVEAQLQQARNDEARSLALRAENPRFISDTEMDQFKFATKSLEAQLDVAIAAVDQAQANLDNSIANLRYTDIRSPVDGIVIDRKIDPGQTLASQFQTPELFIIAEKLREEVHVLASVDEADIGLIQQANEEGRPVHFTVDAYPDDLFEGAIFQVRRNSTTTQNVVTYPVVVSKMGNEDLKLLPGMTASLSFEVGRAEDVLKIPNAALRFYPAREQVHPDDRDILEGAASSVEDEEDDQVSEATPSATEQAEARKNRNRRHVWVKEGEFLRAVEVVTGQSDSKYTELVSGELKEGQSLVTGIQPSN